MFSNIFNNARRCAALATVSIVISLGGMPAAAQSVPSQTQTQNTSVVAPLASPTAVAPAVPASKVTSDKQVDNPYGLEALWKGSDFVARFVLLLLSIMSVGSWYILVTKLLEQRKMNRYARTVSTKFWQAATVAEGVQALEKGSAYRFIAEAGDGAVSDHLGLKRHIPLGDWISMCITAAVDRVQASTQSGLAFLATVGSTSPFVGLFGTVWGIYHALTAIGLSGQASIDKVAGPVGEALIMTAIGLAVAIPAVLAYNWLARRNKAVMDEVREFSDELNAVIVGSTVKAN